MTEVVGFCQEDLDEDDVMLLDTWEEVSTDASSSSPQTYFQRGYGLICLNLLFNLKPRAIRLLSHLQTLHGAWSDNQVYVQSFSPRYETHEWGGITRKGEMETPGPCLALRHEDLDLLQSLSAQTRGWHPETLPLISQHQWWQLALGYWKLTPRALLSEAIGVFSHARVGFSYLQECESCFLKYLCFVTEAKSFLAGSKSGTKFPGDYWETFPILSLLQLAGVNKQPCLHRS